VIHGADKDLLLALFALAPAPAALLPIAIFLKKAVLAGGLGLLSLVRLILLA